MLGPTTVLMTLLGRLGAGEVTAGILGGVETLQGLFQPIGPSLFRSRQHLKRNLMLWGLLAMMPMMGLLSLMVAVGAREHAHPGLVIAGVLASVALFNCVIGVYAGVWGEWWAQLFDRRVRGTIGGLLGCAVWLGMCDGLWFASRLIGAERIGTLAALAFVIMALANLGFCLVRDVDGRHQPAERMPQGRELWRLIRASFADPGVRAVLATRLCGNAVLVLTPFITLQYERAGVSDQAATVCASYMAMGAAVSAVAAGRIGDRWGHRINVRAGLALAVLTAIAAATMTGLLGCAITFAAMGLFMGCWGPAFYIVLESSPHHSRVAHLIGCNLVQAVVTLLLPQAWGRIAAWCGMRPLELVVIGVAVCGLALAFTRLPEPRLRQRTPLPQAA